MVATLPQTGLMWETFGRIISRKRNVSLVCPSNYRRRVIESYMDDEMIHQPMVTMTTITFEPTEGLL